MADVLASLFKDKGRARRSEKTIRQKELNLLRSQLEMGGILAGVSVYVSLMCAAYEYDHPALTFGEVVGGAMGMISKDPLYFIPVAWSLFPTYLSIFLFIILIVMTCSYIVQRNHISNRDVASAAWVTPEELTEELAEPLGESGHNGWNNFIYGQNTYIARNSTYTDKKGVRHEGMHSNNCMVIAETGGGKTFNFLKPNLLQMNCSYVITDPSGSTKQEIGEMLYRFGYNVRSLDIITMMMCNQYNPMKYIKTEADIKNIVQSFIANTKREGETGQSQDPFWDNAMEAFLCAIVSLLWEYGDDATIMDGKVYNKAFPTLCELTRMATAGMDPKYSTDKYYMDYCEASVNEKKPTALGHIFSNIRKATEGQSKPYCLREWENYKLAPEKTATTILITTSVKLDPFEVRNVINLTSNDTINLNTFGETRDVIFISTPQTQEGKPYMFLASFLYSQLFSVLFNRGNYEMDGSHSIKLQSGEHVRWFRKEVPMEEIQEVLDSYKGARLLEVKSYFDENDVYYAIVDASYSEDEARELGGIDQADAYRRYIQYVESHSISRRPTLELAQKYLNDLAKAKIITHHGEANPTTCRFMIDEFANIGEIPQFLQILATVRKYNIVVDVILQSRDQLKRMYEKSFSEVEDNCPITVFLGGNGAETTKAISERLGKESIVVQNVTTDASKVSSSHNTQARDLMDSSEVGRMDMTDELILLSHHQPAIDKKFNTLEHPMYKYTRDYIKKQPGKERFCLYDNNRFPEIAKDVPLAIPVITHSEEMVCIQTFSQDALMQALGKANAELYDAAEKGLKEAITERIFSEPITA